MGFVPKPGKVLGLILAGGDSQRFGSDKRLAELDGQPLLARVAIRAIDQVDVLALNAARDPAHLCLPLVPDDRPGEGPLTGLLSGLRFAEKHGLDAVVTFPCDTPFFPADMVERLKTALSGECGFALASYRSEIQSAFSLVRVSQLAQMEEAFASGMRSIKGMGRVLHCTFADFSDCTEGPEGNAFFNINHAADLAAAKAWLASRQRMSED